MPRGPPAELFHLREPVLKPPLRAGGPQSLATADWTRGEWLTRAGLHLPPGNLKLNCWTGEQATSAMCPEEQEGQDAGAEQRLRPGDDRDTHSALGGGQRGKEKEG